MTRAFFLCFVFVVAVGTILIFGRYLGKRPVFAVSSGLLVWLVYVGLIGYLGVIRNATMRPPGAAFLFVPVVVFLVFFVVRLRTIGGADLSLMIPLWLMIAAQSFRVIVELFIHQLWIDGLVPKMLTFAGANVDIYIGASAPIIAWLSTRGRWGLQLTLIWNAMGLLALANVVVRAVLTAPGPFNIIRSEVPDRMIGTFPFMYIPGLFVPLAVILHVLAVRAVLRRMREGSTQPESSDE